MLVGTSRRAALGVTLIELMIAVAIVGILAAIAYPSYQAQVRRGNRTDGKAELIEASQELEKCFTRFGAYNNAGCVSFALTNSGNRRSENRKYAVTFFPGSVTATTYQLQAVLQPGRGTDTDCNTLTLDQTGGQGAINSTGTALTPAAMAAARCW